MCRFSQLGELEVVFGGAGCVDVLGRGDDVRIENLNLFLSACAALREVNNTYKVVAIFEVAADGNLASAVALWPPLAPVKGIDGPGRKIVAGSRLGVGGFVAHGIGRAVGHARVGARANVGQAQWRVGYVAVGGGRSVFGRIGGRSKLRRGAAGRGRGIGMVGGRGIEASGGAGAGIAVREAQRRPGRGRVVLHGGLLLRGMLRRSLLLLLLLLERMLRRLHRGVHGGQRRSGVGGHWVRPRCQATGLQGVGNSRSAEARVGTLGRRGGGCLFKLDLGRIGAR